MIQQQFMKGDNSERLTSLEPLLFQRFHGVQLRFDDVAKRLGKHQRLNSQSATNGNI